MRIFKNRGDIFFSKSNKEKSTEQKILLSLLIFIIVFTVVFLIAVGVKYDFSAKKFFEPENLTVTQENSDDEALPEVSGKTNYVFTVGEEGTLLFTYAIQVDMDNVAYKVSSFKSSTEVEDSTLAKIYSSGGVENVKNAVETLLDTDIDYYISMERKSYIEFFNDLGEVNYPVASDIKFRDSDSSVTYSVKIKAGEQTLDGSDAVNLIRYYLDEEGKTSMANEILLYCLSQQLNSENTENSEKLFSEFAGYSDTNITVRDFSLASDNLTVLSSENAGVAVYSAEAEYDENEITSDSLKTIKGYFVK
ncbi:MAG: LCP family protein [Clostridiales bacterium]|nr:LCP family protein [Clostridiales bacterium]